MPNERFYLCCIHTCQGRQVSMFKPVQSWDMTWASGTATHVNQSGSQLWTHDVFSDSISGDQNEIQ